MVKNLPVDLKGKFIYYVGPVGSCLVMKSLVLQVRQLQLVWTIFLAKSSEHTGLFGMIGKADRGPAAIEAIKDHKATYLMAVGSEAYLRI